MFLFNCRTFFNKMFKAFSVNIDVLIAGQELKSTTFSSRNCTKINSSKLRVFKNILTTLNEHSQVLAPLLICYFV